MEGELGEEEVEVRREMGSRMSEDMLKWGNSNFLVRDFGWRSFGICEGWPLAHRKGNGPKKHALKRTNKTKTPV